jgi:phosphoenolpyruvate carboxykinase (ATP)
MLGERLREHGARCWLVNTGWTGGPYGTGSRMRLSHTRAMIDAALSGALNDAPTRTDPVFGLHVPEKIPGVPDGVLHPRSTWADAAAYDAQASKLAAMFRQNFEKFAGDVDEGVRTAGPT